MATLPGRPVGIPLPPKNERCRTCDGSGRYKQSHPSDRPEKAKVIDCPWCKGTGRKDKRKDW